ncbi:caspase domain-containing protein [Mycena sp. CBHHK59/15]|nr:caspase domain-containing protein [Mycena sp. CBHHK59/15]
MRNSLKSACRPYEYQRTPRGILRPPVHRPHYAQAPPPSPRHHHHARPAPQPPVPVQRHHVALVMPPVSPHFQYSKCTGRRKALCVSPTSPLQSTSVTSHELRGCINDAKHVFNFLVRARGGYKAEDIVILTDDAPHARSQPTRRNIIDAMRWLVRDARPHDALFFHYSGHGGQTRDLDGDEVDGYDEVIYPVDYKRHEHIVDDEMHLIMVKPLPVGCRLTSCHSGTALGTLSCLYSSSGRLKGSHATPADVISLSGCKDGQTSADTFAAASPSAQRATDEHPHQSYQELLHNVRLILHPKFSQKPQLGSSHPIDTSLKFIM